ncbi:hypothetical protein [Budvicia aquatica]|uniref:Uncharacterized protein n=1 Tax=Budvicia aquatica TaxID=82979 RepID=A0A2C6DK17_9GAMM|nr:hypothetical protein [Budvicia aquatica]PHI29171.1 hypothetical protein CRN84_07475 [Budvicia aquatica]VFS47358.1 Uncharacterised protein [Budvicia aquatica]
MQINITPFLVVSALLLTACDNNSHLTIVRSLPLPALVTASANTKMTLGEALDKRPACDKTVWSQMDTRDNSSAASTQPATVEYQCTLSATQTQALFSSQWTDWVERHQRRLADSEKLKIAALDKKTSEHPRQTLSTARWVFEELQSSGDLARYKALIKDSPARTLRLDAVNAYFASPEGQAYLSTTQKTKSRVTAAKAALKAVTQVVAASGLATDTHNLDACQAPILFVLAIVLTPEEVALGLSECESTVDQRYQTDIASAERQADVARAMLDKLKQPIGLIDVKEIITWAVPTNGTPQIATHTLVLDIKVGETPRQVTKAMGITDSDLAVVLAGEISGAHQNALISAMSDLVR